MSTDGITYKNVVCKRTSNVTGTTPVNREDTDCGNFPALGSNELSVDFEGVFNTNISATEFSATQILQFWEAQQLLWLKILQPYIAGQGYISAVGVQYTAGNLVAFTLTFTFTGDPQLTP